MTAVALEIIRPAWFRDQAWRWQHLLGPFAPTDRQKLLAALRSAMGGLPPRPLPPATGDAVCRWLFGNQGLQFGARMLTARLLLPWLEQLALAEPAKLGSLRSALPPPLRPERESLLCLARRGILGSSDFGLVASKVLPNSKLGRAIAELPSRRATATTNGTDCDEPELAMARIESSRWATFAAVCAALDASGPGAKRAPKVRLTAAPVAPAPAAAATDETKLRSAPSPALPDRDNWLRACAPHAPLRALARAAWPGVSFEPVHGEDKPLAECSRDEVALLLLLNPPPAKTSAVLAPILKAIRSAHPNGWCLRPARAVALARRVEKSHVPEELAILCLEGALSADADRQTGLRERLEHLIAHEALRGGSGVLLKRMRQAARAL